VFTYFNIVRFFRADLLISLLQYFLAILVEAEIITLPLDKYYFHITSELLTLYPIFQNNVDLIFQYDL